MKTNNKGFSISGILYPLFLIMLVFVTLILLVLINSKFTLDKTKNEISEDMSGDGVVCAYTNWMTEEELIADGKATDDTDVQNKTEYGYQDVAGWSDTYIETKPNDGYYKEKTQYRAKKKESKRYYYSTADLGEQSLPSGWTGGDMIRIRCGSYCNGGFSGRGNYNTNTGALVCSECTRYVDECTSNYTEWSDTQVNTGCSAQTRTVYATPIWAEIDETVWNPESIYEATDTRRLVTRTTYRYYKCER